MNLKIFQDEFEEYADEINSENNSLHIYNYKHFAATFNK